MSPDFTASLDAICDEVQALSRALEIVLMELNELRRDTMRGSRQIPTPIERKAA